MKTIQLNRLTLQNFQGRSFTLEAGGEDVDVFAANNIGKTRNVSAFTWLLFDKDSMCRSDFEIKNIDVTGQHEHMLEHSVEAELSEDDEGLLSSVTLKKVYYEKWTKKRGSADRTFGGHTTDFYIDGVPAQKKEFTAKVAEIAGDEAAFRLLTSPHAFPSLHWQKQRDILLGMCGDLRDSDVIDSMATLQNKDAVADLTNIINGRGLDNHKKIIAARRSEINKELEKIPVRISENQKMLPDVSGLDLAKLQYDILELDTELNAKKLELQGINTGGRIAELSKELSIINADIQKIENAYSKKEFDRLSVINREIEDVKDAGRRSHGRMAEIDNIITTKKRRFAQVEAELVSLRDKWSDIDSEVFQDTIKTACAACGQSLPPDKVQAAREKAQAVFNNDKAERLKSITDKGTHLAAERDEIIELTGVLAKEKAEIMHSLPGQEERLASLLEKQQEKSEYKFAPQELLDRQGYLIDEIDAEKAGKSQDTEQMEGDIATLSEQLKNLKADADKFRQREQGEKRIEELKAQEKALAAEFEKLERELYLMEQFTRTKCSMLTERINDLFEFVKFKLFNELVNGGIEECCVMTVDGVPYGAGLGNSASIKAGLDVVRALQRHYGLSAPVFVDNRESCTLIPAMGCQVISLYVSPEDVVMRVQQSSKAVAA